MNPAPRMSAIVLAAGRSERMGRRNKLLLEIDGEPMIRRTVRRFVECSLEECVVVLGFEAERVAEALTEIPCRTVENEDWRSGQMSRRGVRRSWGHPVKNRSTGTVRQRDLSRVSMIVVSTMLSGAGSVAVSARPTLPSTLWTSGN